MRIISGKYKSRRIQVPTNFKARPTTDFARENLFNVLNNIIDWEETNALDLFSGTGSVAIELVSRGCPRVVCVEMNPLHYNFICKAKDILKANELFPLKADVFKYLSTSHEKFDLIFADPPYEMPDIESIPKLILDKGLLNNGGIFVLEHSKKYNFAEYDSFQEERVYGSVHFTFFKIKQ
ncbi:MAG: RsmD family RNA methyltransferase [Dysgonamonadaceae bacterium]|jgi:16S rRNA (guanine(966)-N(2))-methyltransferase RsmD|nr:RsmD family RNA methyltransferase [Dysgonamonadaceae bacterium]MDD3309780.1 RsmD family RNA methyltransferase [Dysgonamonadaceae bacterium]MDD3899610.1 RsmD family RNA methyltransferase [Dysgonamonadaceae bacterium]MDD4398123.1 RsmD family RNA methyltransferase [Dysgonamonadaceae bacterium]MEA5081888.1 RsmD family RNA methyltransferase [Dysgonamonadaceae bacterium]